MLNLGEDTDFTCLQYLTFTPSIAEIGIELPDHARNVLWEANLVF